jgi:pyrrolidone-carboxylate peptidase
LPNVEEYRALPETGAAANVPTDALEILNSSGLSHVGAALARDLARTSTAAAAARVVRSHGQGLWTRATARAQGKTANTDDRPLYWARLQLTRTLRQWDPRFTLTDAQREALMQDLERASRGMDTISFGRSGNAKRILISGFDPFGLDLAAYGRTRASNPSGAAVLALDGRRVHNQSIDGVLQGVIFPVRYADFDAGVVENVFRPFISGPNAVDMIMSISMGARGSDFEVEQYAGRRRQAGIDDNLGQAQAGPSTPAGRGPEFLPTTLPPSARGALGRTRPNTEETEVTEIPAGGTSPVHRPTGPTKGSTAVEGSGGGFLSNEIFYRASLLRLQSGSQIPVGHLHTPFLTPGLSSAAFEALRTSIVSRIEQIVTATLPDL